MQDIFRQIMDHFTLIYLFTIFCGICLWVIFGRAKPYRDSARMIFRNEDRPASAGDRTEARR
ncbi:cbb3-type cytochrome oxidase subunit 3 [Mangrovicoccus algicola]|uniref:Cbb3-type cytochrome c oxidase subunit 3 n=1 Tax=Mangrovicoccus algicola TaxID=2771008 RepID=A0A8J6YWG7_9RHOB|nr:cbb3-type cytochrome c oxidase subunit 3 [Mangrovicoccus algicola]MBE3637519.1 cbb3-type cytochrome c oxidase subunit 3 [Mangrovicoccus algicola]